MEKDLIKFDWHKESVLRLITSWQNYECLYDSKHELYHNRQARYEALSQVADSLKVFSPNIGPNEVKCKITYLRGQYTREIAKQRDKQGGPVPSAYWFRELAFLEDYVNVRKVGSNSSCSVLGVTYSGDEIKPTEKLNIKSEDSNSYLGEDDAVYSGEYLTDSPNHFYHHESAVKQTKAHSSPPPVNETWEVSLEAPSSVKRKKTPIQSKKVAVRRMTTSQQLRLDFEKEKFEKELEIKNRQLILDEKKLFKEINIRDRQINLDEEKFRFEKECQNRQFELNKLQLEKDNNIRKLEIEKNERIAMYEIEMKYKKN